MKGKIKKILKSKKIRVVGCLIILFIAIGIINISKNISNDNNYESTKDSTETSTHVTKTTLEETEALTEDSDVITRPTYKYNSTFPAKGTSNQTK